MNVFCEAPTRSYARKYISIRTCECLYIYKIYVYNVYIHECTFRWSCFTGDMAHERLLRGAHQDRKALSLPPFLLTHTHIHTHTHTSTHTHAHAHTHTHSLSLPPSRTHTYTCTHTAGFASPRIWPISYGVASVSRIDKTTGLFCKTAL